MCDGKEGYFLDVVFVFNSFYFPGITCIVVSFVLVCLFLEKGMMLAHNAL